MKVGFFLRFTRYMYFHATAILVYRDRLTDIDGQTNMNEVEYDLIEEHFMKQ